MRVTEEEVEIDEEDLQEEDDPDMDLAKVIGIRATKLESLAYARIRPHIDSEASNSGAPRLDILEVVPAH
ncbi:hypothetical protein HAX54_038026, partial [Datura stramonium]|nr:hypothetical protein [Datura stramonium]